MPPRPVQLTSRGERKNAEMKKGWAISEQMGLTDVFAWLEALVFLPRENPEGVGTKVVTLRKYPR